MKIFLGVDGGATETLSIAGDETGEITGQGLGGPTNYQLVGLEQTMANLKTAVSGSLKSSGISPKDLTGAVFGLAGADYPQDFVTLRKALMLAFPGLPFQLANDTWVAFKAGTEKKFGAVVISGTGFNYGVRGPGGKEVTGRGMGYEWGSKGGATSIIRSALHHAFRSHDGTGPKTCLETAVLDLLDFASYDDLSLYLYRLDSRFAPLYRRGASLVPAVFQLASEGDRISQRILSNIGETMGEIMGRLVRNMDMGEIEADVVLAGSTFTKGITVTTCMVTAFKSACRRFAPQTVFRFPKMEPAGGAYLLALENAGSDHLGPAREKVLAFFSRGKSE